MRSPRLRHWMTGVRVATTIVMISVLLPASQFTNPDRVLANHYQCGSPFSGHCFGTNLWNGNTNGVQTHLDIRQIDCTTCSYATFVNVAQWYYTSNREYWIEVGYGSFNYPTERYNTFNHRVSYYWTDVRPGWGYYEHEMEIVPAGDYGPNKYVDVEIQTTNTPNQYRVFLISPNYAPPTSYSTDNTMGLGYTIMVGGEVAGSHGAAIPDLYIYDNRWIDSAGNQHLQWEDGYSIFNPGPINSGWAFRPSQYRGGSYHLQCGC